MNSYHTMKDNDLVYFKDGTYMGRVACKAIAHNGKDIGSVCVETDKKLFWIRGRCCAKFLDDNDKKGWVYLEDKIKIYEKDEEGRAIPEDNIMIYD